MLFDEITICFKAAKVFYLKNKWVSLKNLSVKPQFYNYILYLPNHSYITTVLTNYGSYKTGAPFDLPAQNS